MKIGYLHIGPPEHGVCRYGRLLAAEARRRPELEVIEADVLLTNDRQYNQQILVQAAEQLRAADIIHFQFNKYNKVLWGGGSSQLDHLRFFMNSCSSPLVVTLHDVFYPPYGLAGVMKHLRSKLKPTTQTITASSSNKEMIATPPSEPSQPKRSKLSKALGFLQATSEGMFGADALALRQIAKRANFMFVCTQEEAQRVCDRIPKHKLKVIPHFVETRTIDISPSKASKLLGLEGFKVVTLLGFIYPPKGHQIMVEAMSELPPDVKVVFAGGPSSASYEHLVDDLMALAKKNGVDDRLRITGYLSEEELELYLIATDLAVCPFSRFSASGSLSTWISIARPILASDFPQVAEYNKLEPNAIKTFKPYTSTALAQAIRQLISTTQATEDSSVASLRQKLSMPVIFDEHLTYYRRILPGCSSSKTFKN